MIRFLSVACSLGLASACLIADPAAQEKVTQAAKKLADSSGYSWTTTTESANNNRGRMGPTVGKTQKDGLTHLTMTRGENTSEAVMKGSSSAIKTDSGWVSSSEIASAGGGGGGGQGNPGRMMARMLTTYKLPAAEAQAVVAKTKSLSQQGDVLSGDLTEEGVKELLTLGRRAGSEAPPPTNGKGAVKFWVKDGVLSKYEIQVQGTMSWNGNEMEINRTTTVEIRDVGSTTVNVPDEAKKKLS